MGASTGFDTPKEAELVQAACRGDSSAVKRLVVEGANPNATSPNVGTLLVKAIQCQNPTGLRALLEAGADPNLSPKKGDWSPLMAASAFDNAEVIEVLVKAGAQIDYVSEDAVMPTPLEVALARGIESGNWTAYEKLLQLGANINLSYDDNRTIAEQAAILGQMDRVYDLLKAGYRHDLQTLEATVRARRGTSEMESEKARVLERLQELRQSK